MSAPVALEAEQSVLGGLMLAPDALARIDWLAEADFSSQQHRMIFRAISELTTKGDACDPVTLADWFDKNGVGDLIGGSVYVLQLASATPGAANIVAYAEIVLEKSRLRSAMDLGAKLVSAAKTRAAESGLIVAQAMHDLAQLETTRLRGGLQPAGQLMKSYFREFQSRYTAGPGLLGIPTPWHDLNEITKGLRPGVLYIVGARPSTGKSVFGLQLAAFTAFRNDAAAFFSAEMTGDECIGRIMACSGNIDHDWLEQPNNKHDSSELFWGRSSTVAADIKKAPLLIDETPAIRIDQLMARARKAHLQRPLRLIVADHLHDMDHGSKPEAIRHEIGRAVQGFKTLAKELNCPVVVLCQLNRGAAGKRPEIRDLRESGDIEQKADVVIFMHKEDNINKETHLRNIVELIPAKGRNIRIGKSVYLEARFDQMRLEDHIGPLPQPMVDDEKAATKKAAQSRGYESRKGQ